MAVVIGGPQLLMMLVLGLHIDLDQHEDEATPCFTPVATPESSFFLFTCFSVSTLKMSINASVVLGYQPNETYISSYFCGLCCTGICLHTRHG